MVPWEQSSPGNHLLLETPEQPAKPVIHREGSYWVVREGEGARDTVLRVLLPTPPADAPAHPDSAFEATFPPSAGWEYLEARRQRWVEDSTLMVHQREGGCPEVVVEVGEERG